jgi:hypothetical protein
VEDRPNFVNKLTEENSSPIPFLRHNGFRTQTQEAFLAHSEQNVPKLRHVCSLEEFDNQ